VIGMRRCLLLGRRGGRFLQAGDKVFISFMAFERRSVLDFGFKFECPCRVH
jgi:hypothetical protein